MRTNSSSLPNQGVSNHQPEPFFSEIPPDSVTEAVSHTYAPPEGGNVPEPPESFHRVRGWDMVASTKNSPWERGRRASIVRKKALKKLGDTLLRFAAVLAADKPRDFEEDSIRLTSLEECVTFIDKICAKYPECEPDDVRAAIVSAYVELLERTHGRLYLVYRDSIAARLKPILAPRIKSIRLRMSGDDLRESILEPMAHYFLCSLRNLESNPNDLRPAKGYSRRLCTRRYGWSPGDPLSASLSLLTMKQSFKHKWPHAFTYSPLGYMLRAGGFAQIMPFRTLKCHSCQGDFVEKTLGGKCPTCGSVLAQEEPDYLLSTRYVEEEIARGAGDNLSSPVGHPVAAEVAGEMASPEATETPSEQMLRAEDSKESRNVRLERALCVWHAAMRRMLQSSCTAAMLLGLAGLDNVPDIEGLKHPKEQWLISIIDGCLPGNSNAHEIERRAGKLLQEISRLAGTGDSDTLTRANTRVIVCRVRRRIYGGSWNGPGSRL